MINRVEPIVSRSGLVLDPSVAWRTVLKSIAAHAARPTRGPGNSWLHRVAAKVSARDRTMNPDSRRTKIERLEDRLCR
jgi:hypothetical protein